MTRAARQARRGARGGDGAAARPAAGRTVGAPPPPPSPAPSLQVAAAAPRGPSGRGRGQARGSRPREWAAPPASTSRQSGVIYCRDSDESARPARPPACRRARGPCTASSSRPTPPTPSPEPRVRSPGAARARRAAKALGSGSSTGSAGPRRPPAGAGGATAAAARRPRPRPATPASGKRRASARCRGPPPRPAGGAPAEFSGLVGLRRWSLRRSLLFIWEGGNEGPGNGRTLKTPGGSESRFGVENLEAGESGGWPGSYPEKAGLGQLWRRVGIIGAFGDEFH